MSICLELETYVDSVKWLGYNISSTKKLLGIQVESMI